MRSTTFLEPTVRELDLAQSRPMITVVLVASMAIILPALAWGIPSSRDLVNHFRFTLPFFDALAHGHWYPGWLAESNGGFGDASFRFYPPGLYYLLSVFRALTGNWYAATVATSTTLSLVGALGVYFWAKEFGSGETAMWAAIFYVIAPYHLNQFYQSFMLAEFAGAAVLPFAFAFVERVCRHRRKRDTGGLAASYALLVLTHLPLAVIGSIALIFYALLRLRREQRLATFVALTSSALMGLGASACYWTTMLIELKWIRADNVNPEPGLDYRENFVLSTFSPNYLNVWWMNILLLASVAMFWPAVVLARKSARRLISNERADSSVDRTIGTMALLLLLTIYMATPLSRPIWNLVRPLQETQFPWRWLSITSMAWAILLAMAIPFWKALAKGKKRRLVLVAAGTAVVSLSFSLSHVVGEAKWLSPTQFNQTLNKIPGSASVYQWLPIGVKDPLPQMSMLVDAGDRQVQIESWAPERRTFRVSQGQSTEIRVRTFYYQHWRAFSENGELAVYPDCDGVTLIRLPHDAATVSFEFREPKRVRYASAVTLIAWGLIAGLFLPTRKVKSAA